MKIEILRIKAFDGDGKKKAAVDIKIGGMITIYGCSLVEGNDGLFLGLPQRKDGKVENKWWPVVKIEDATLYTQVKDKAVEAYAQQNAGRPATPADVEWEE